jgi:hypothetical protein
MEIHNNLGEKIGESMPVYDPITESVYCDGERIYQETGTGEVDLRQVMAGDETFEDGTPFAFKDFLQECLGLAIYP